MSCNISLVAAIPHALAAVDSDVTDIFETPSRFRTVS